MLTKAIIQSIDYTKNLCRVRIPLFENASRNVNMIEADAQFSIVPGVYNSYKTGDVVFIGFEENKMELPVILGKLFVSTAAEASSCRGSLSGDALTITDTAKLPYSTVFSYDKITQNDKLYQDLNTPKKLADGIINLQRAQVQKYQTVLEIVYNDIIYKLYLKTSNDFTYTPSGSEEPLCRLCTALKNSQTENIAIPLDLAATENEVYPATIQVQEFNSTVLKLNVTIGGNIFTIEKQAIRGVQSSAIYY
jgi:hypothetical protein